MDGVLVVDKPEGPTSHDVVSCARRVLATRSIGHTGTLDPMATGVLVLVVGRATRLAQFYAGHRKSYDATLRLGVVTDTWDRTGTPVAASPGPLPGPAEIERQLGAFLGRHEQMPPPFSAKMIDGVRAHELARRGREVPVSAASVELHECELAACEPPLVRLRLTTSAGYYVRSLVHDLGQALGCGACLEQLRRTASGSFEASVASPLDWLLTHQAEAGSRVVPLEALLPEFPAVVLGEADARRAAHGNEIVADVAMVTSAVSTGSSVRLLAPDGRLLAIARPTGRPGVLHPAVVLG